MLNRKEKLCADRKADNLMRQLKIFNRRLKACKAYRLENFQISYKQRLFKALEINSMVLNQDDKFLDIGAGGMAYLVIEASKEGCRSFGVDLSEEAMKKSRYFADHNGNSNLCSFITCSADALPLKENTFSKISSIAVLEHLSDDHRAISEIARILKPRGRIFITVPNRYQHIPWVFRGYLKWADKITGHLRRYEAKQLIKEFEKHHFVLEKLVYNGHLIKMIQYFLSLIWPPIRKTKSKMWWKMEEMDLRLSDIKTGVHFTLIMQKQ